MYHMYQSKTQDAINEYTAVYLLQRLQISERTSLGNLAPAEFCFWYSLNQIVNAYKCKYSWQLSNEILFMRASDET